jgi:hypothetical protein
VYKFENGIDMLNVLEFTFAKRKRTYEKLSVALLSYIYATVYILY